MISLENKLKMLLFIKYLLKYYKTTVFYYINYFFMIHSLFLKSFYLIFVGHSQSQFVKMPLLIPNTRPFTTYLVLCLKTFNTITLFFLIKYFLTVFLLHETINSMKAGILSWSLLYHQDIAQCQAHNQFLIYIIQLND